jgi:hypothetical protein
LMRSGPPLPKSTARIAVMESPDLSSLSIRGY